jgi:hypothetical protein
LFTRIEIERRDAEAKRRRQAEEEKKKARELEDKRRREVAKRQQHEDRECSEDLHHFVLRVT